MFSKSEAKQLRQEFWIAFEKSFPRKWILYDTKIKDFSFKFHFDANKAMVSLDIENKNLEKRFELWKKLNSLKVVLTENYLPKIQFEEYTYLENKTEISRIYVLKEKVSIHNKNTWQETMVFLQENMVKFETFFNDFEDIFTN